jgi:lipopolysaccharide exporter
VLVISLGVFASGLGVQGAAIAVLATSVVCTPIYLFQLRRCLGIGPLVFLRAIARPAIAASAMALLVHFGLPAIDAPSTAEAGLWLAVGSAAGFVSYVLLILLLWWLEGRPAGPEQMLLDRLPRRLVAGLGLSSTER